MDDIVTAEKKRKKKKKKEEINDASNKGMMGKDYER